MTETHTTLTFEEYANLDAATWGQLGLPEGRFEFVNGTEGSLIELPSESELNDWVARYLFLLLANSRIVSPRLIAIHTCELEVAGKPKTRFPDLVILRDEHLEQTKSRLLIRWEMPPPRLVVEVVSPGDANTQRDYTAKRSQYQARGIPEYWLIEPIAQSVTVLTLEAGQYVEQGVFQGDTPIHSPELGALPIAAAQLFEAGQ